MGKNAKLRDESQKRPPTLVAAATLLVSLAALHFVFGLIAAVMTPWDTVLASSPVNRGLTTMGLVLGAFFGAGGFIATPIAAATDAWAHRRRSLVFAALCMIIAIGASLAGYVLAIASVLLSAMALALLLRRPSRTLLKPVEAAQRRWSPAMGYVLMAFGGPWGLHNFYLNRSWAGVLYVGLLIFGTGTWGGLMSFLCFGLLGGMLAIDAIRLPSRARQLCLDSPFAQGRRL